MNRVPSMILVSLLAAGCSAGAPPPETTPIERELWHSVLDSGLAVAPVAGVKVLGGSADVMSFVGEEVHAVLQARLPGTRVESPVEVHAKLSSSGENAHARLRSIRRRIVRQSGLDAGELQSLATEIDERFILLAWMDEGTEEGLHETNLDDLEAFNYSIEVHRFPTGAMRGRIHGNLLDLVRGQEIWSTTVEYEAEGLDGPTAASRRIVTQSRGDAAGRLAEELAAAGQW